MNEYQCLFQYIYKQVTPQDDLWSMARMKKQNESEKNEMEMKIKAR